MDSGSVDVDPYGQAAAGQSAELQAYYPLEPETRTALEAVVADGPGVAEKGLAGARAHAGIVASSRDAPSADYATQAEALVGVVQGVDDWVEDAFDLVADADDEQADDPADLKLIDRAEAAAFDADDALAEALPELAAEVVIEGTSTERLPDYATAVARLKKGIPLDLAPTLAELATAEAPVVESAVTVKAAGAGITAPAEGKETTVTRLAETHHRTEEHHRRYLLVHLISSGAHLEAVNQVADAWSLSTADFADQLAGLLDWKTGVAVEDVPRAKQHNFLRAVGIAAYKTERHQAKDFEFAAFGHAYAGMCRALNAKIGVPADKPEAAAAATTANLEWREARAVIAATLADHRGEEGADPALVKYADEAIAVIDGKIANYVSEASIEGGATDGVAVDDEVANRKALAELKAASKAFVSCQDGLKKSLEAHQGVYTGLALDSGGDFGTLLKFAKGVKEVSDAHEAAGKAHRAGLTDQADEETWKLLTGVGGLMKDALEEVLNRGVDKLLELSKSAADKAAAESAARLAGQYQKCSALLARGVGTLLALPGLFFAVKKLMELPDDAGGQAELDAIMGVVSAGGTVAATAAGVSTLPVGIATASVHLTLTIMGQLGGMLKRIENEALAKDVKALVEQARSASKSASRTHSAQKLVLDGMARNMAAGGAKGFDATLQATYERKFRALVKTTATQTRAIGNKLSGRALRKSGADLDFRAHAELIDLDKVAPKTTPEAFADASALGDTLPKVFKGVERVSQAAADSME